MNTTISVCKGMKDKFGLTEEQYLDLLSEAQAILIERRVQIHEAQHPKAFSRRLIHNYLLNYIRDNILHAPTLISVDMHACQCEYDIPESLPEDILHIRMCLNLLEPNERWLIDQKFLLRRTWTELAHETNTPVMTLRRRVKEILYKLR